MAKLAATTYGDALFELAVQEDKVDALYEEAKVVLTAFSDNGELVKLLNHPKVNKEEKKEFAENVFSRFVSRDMAGFLLIMIDKQRQMNIMDALEYFVERVLEYKKTGRAFVTTAKELSEEQKKRIVNRLLETTKYKDFIVEYSVDESLIGGMIIRINDRIVDSSIKNRLDDMARDLKKIQLG